MRNDIMPILGINFRSINASSGEKELNENISVNSTPRIDHIEKSEKEIAGFKDVLKVSFTFETKYEPSVGEIIMKGDVFYQTDNPNAVVSKWKKEKKLDDQLALEVLNMLFRKCLTRVIDLSADLRLPPPLQFPVVQPAQKGKQ